MSQNPSNLINYNVLIRKEERSINMDNLEWLTFACLCLNAGNVTRTKATAKNFIPELNSSVLTSNSKTLHASAFNSGNGSRTCICKYIMISWKYGCRIEEAFRNTVLLIRHPNTLHSKYLIYSDSSITWCISSPAAPPILSWRSTALPLLYYSCISILVMNTFISSS